MSREKRPHLRIVKEGESPINHGVVYDLLTQMITGKMVDNPTLMRAALNDVYEALSLRDQPLITMLTELETDGVIGRDDKMYWFVLCAVVATHGVVEMVGLRDDIVYRRVNAASVEQIIAQLPLSSAIRRYLVDGLHRIELAQGRK